MVLPRQELLGAITELDEDGYGTVTCNGATFIRSSGFAPDQQSSPPAHWGSGTPRSGVFWVDDSDPVLPKFTDSDGTSFTLSTSIPGLPTVLGIDNTTGGTDIVFDGSSNISRSGTSDFNISYAGVTGGAGGSITIRSQEAPVTASGDVNLVGSGGGVTGGSVTVQGGSTTNDGGSGGSFTVTAGDGGAFTNSTGGVISLSAGDANGSGIGGSVTINAGDSTTGLSGNINLNAGSTTGHPGTNGNITLTGGSNSAASGTAGLVQLVGGDGSTGTNVIGGQVSLVGGRGSGTANGGRVSLFTLPGGNSGGDSGAISLQTSPGGTGGNGGDISLDAGDGILGGDVSIIAGASINGVGGAITLTPGQGQTLAVPDPANHGSIYFRDHDINVVAEISARSGLTAPFTVFTDVDIQGKLTVSGLIDPTGMVFDLQASVPGGTPAADKATLWIRDTDGYIVVTDELGNDAVYLPGGGGGSSSLSQVLSVGNETGDNDIELSGTGTIITADATGTVKDIDLTAGASTDGNVGGGINLTTGTSTGGSGTGSSITLNGGGNATTGSISIDAGNAQTGTTQGGNIEVYGGTGGNTTGNGGGIGLYSGGVTAGGSGNGGYFNLYAGDGGSGGGDGGTVEIYAGGGNGGGVGGNVNIYSGGGASNGVINLGNNAGTDILAVYDNATNSGFLFESSASSPLISQTNVASGNAADMKIQAQSTSSSGDGGDLTLQAGDASGANTAGNVLLNAGDTNGEIHFQTNAGVNLLARVWGDFSGFDTANFQFTQNVDEAYLGIDNNQTRSGDVGATLRVLSGYGDNGGGDLYLVAVDALNVSSTNGGSVYLQSGEGGNSGGDGGALNIIARGAPAGTGGSITLTPGSGGVAAGAVTIATDSENVLVIGSENTQAPFEVFTDGYFQDNLTIGGKLTVAGLIDPTGMVFDLQSSVPGGNPAAGKSTLWVRDTDGYVIITDENGDEIVLSGTFPTPSLSEVLAIGADANSVNITNLADPINPQDAATKAYIDGYTFPETPTPTLAEVTAEGNSAGSVRITDVLDPVDPQDVATKNWVETQIAASTFRIVHENVDVTTSNQTEFTLSYTPHDGYDGYSVLMFLNQLKVELADYDVTGNVVTYAGAETIGTADDVEFYYPVTSGTTGSSVSTVFVSLLAGVDTNDSSVWKVVGATEINSTDVSGSATFEAILSTSDGYADGYARLFNVTTSSTVGSEITTVSEAPTLLTTPIVLDSGSNIYEVQIKTEQIGSGEFTSCSMARVKLE